MNLMRIKRRGKTHLLFLPSTKREAFLLAEVFSAPSFSISAEGSTVETDLAVADYCMVVDYSPAEPKKEAA